MLAIAWSAACTTPVRLQATTPGSRACVTQCRGKGSAPRKDLRFPSYPPDEDVADCVEACPGIAISDGECDVREEALDVCVQGERFALFRSVLAAGGAAVGAFVLLLLALVASCGGECFA